MAEKPKIVAISYIMGDGEHKLVALDSAGQMFERTRDGKAYNYRPGEQAGFVWIRLKGPHED